jgi:MFS family permease
MTDTALTLDPRLSARMERNLRLLPWWWVLRWTWLGEAIWVIYLIEDRGLTLGQVLYFEAAFAAMSVLAEVPTGMAADRWGRRPMLAAGSLAWAVAFLVFGLGETIPVLLASYVLFSLGQSLFSGADDAMLFDTLQALRRGEEFAHRAGRLNARVGVAVAGFTILGGAMVRWTPLAWPMVISVVPSLVAAGAALVLTEPPQAERHSSYLRTGVEALRRVRQRPALFWTMAIFACVQGAAGIVYITLQPIVLTYGVPVWALGLFAAASMLGNAAGGWFAGPLARRLPLGRLFLGAGLLAAAAPIAGASGLLVLFPLFIVPHFAWAVVQPHVSDFLARRTPDSERATMLSINQLTAQCGTIAITLTLGFAIDRWGTGVTLTAASAILLAVVAAIVVAWQRSGDTVMEPAAIA